MRLVDVDHRVELVGEPGIEVVRDAFGLGPVDDADRALQPPAPQLARLEPEPVRLALVEQLPPNFPGARSGRAYAPQDVKSNV